MPLSSPLPEAVRQQVRRELAARGVTTDEAAAPLLHGNWRKPATPPLAEFVRSCLIIEKEGESGTGLIPFTLWAEQEAALEVVQREPFLVWPKGRQIGATWLELAAMLHAARFGGNRLMNIARQSDEYAQDGIRRVLILAGYDPNSDPPNLRVLPESPMPEAWRPKIVAKTTRSLTLANGSRFEAKTATRSIARGDAAYWTLCDEYAFWPWPEKQLAALEHGASRVHVVSTGENEEDAFHQLYIVAVRGQGKWRPHFTSASADPRRDAEWFRINVDEAASPDLARRELARSVEDVFRPATGNYFKRFSRETHVREFSLVPDWPVTYGVDFGFVHPVCLWIQTAPSGQPFVFAEYLPEEIPTPEFAEGIKATEADVLGILEVKHLLDQLELRQPDLFRELRKPLFVSDSTHALKLLEILREEQQSLALVVDEYGDIQGLVTISDVMSVVLGRLQAGEEHDEEALVVERHDGSLLVDGGLHIDELRELTGERLTDAEEHDYHTAAGLVIAHFGRIPHVGEHFMLGMWRVEVVDLDGPRIDKLLLQRLPDVRDGGDDDGT